MHNAAKTFAFPTGKANTIINTHICYCFSKTKTIYHQTYIIFLPYANHRPIDMILPTMNPLPALANDFPIK